MDKETLQIALSLADSLTLQFALIMAVVALWRAIGKLVAYIATIHREQIESLEEMAVMAGDKE